MQSLKSKCDALNAWVEDVKNWIIILEKKEFLPTYKFSKARWWATSHENIHVSARIEMYGFGKIYKLVGLGSDKYKLDEIPAEQWDKPVLSALFDPPGQDTILPDSIIFPESDAWPHLDPPPNTELIYRAKYWPPDTYVKDLVMKRNFMTAPEFEVWAKTIDDMHKDVGGKTPTYIIDKPVIQVPDTVH